MTEQERLEAFHKKLDDDKGLKSKRQLVTYLSLVILAINLSGAKIKEANTFLFKIDFIRPEGLNLLLSLVLVFCVIRYINYSCKYSYILASFWKRRFLSDKRILFYDDTRPDYHGLLEKTLIKIIEEGEKVPIENQYYEMKFFFRRYYIYFGTDSETGIKLDPIKIPIKSTLKRIDYLKLLIIEYSYRIEALIYHRESLDLRSPTLLALLACLSISFKDSLPDLLVFFK
jgi:hypothetical protein